MEQNVGLLVILSLFSLSQYFTVANKWDMLKTINEQATWKAAPNHITEKGEAFMEDILGTIIDSKMKSMPRYLPPKLRSDLPESFDAREVWPFCSTIFSIKDQSHCGSCWAVSTAAAMSDRLCIVSKGMTQVNISAQHLLTCCPNCGYKCNGGYPNEAWNWFNSHGLVTGGDWDSKEGCQPYKIEPCNGNCTLKDEELVCLDYKCTNDHYPTNFYEDFYTGQNAFIIENDIQAIQQELMLNGPLVAAYYVYSDFMYYKSGVYQYVEGPIRGAHAVKLIGWGVENGIPYWLASNSWSRAWGDNGTFKIRRGNNECSFEEYITGGTMYGYE